MSDDEEPPPEVNGSWDRLKGEDYLTPLHNKNAKALQLMIKDHEIPRTYWVTDGDHGNKLDHCLLARSRDAVAAWAEAQRADDPHYMCPWEVMCVCVCERENMSCMCVRERVCMWPLHTCFCPHLVV